MVVAYSALLVWPFITLAVFAIFRPATATAIVFMGGTMFLPSATRFDLPILPEIGKEEVIAASGLLATYVFARGRMRRAKLGRGLEALIGISIIGGILSVFANMDPLVAGPLVVRGASPTEFVARTIEQVLRWGIPFFVGRAIYTRSRDGRTLLVAFVVGGFIYTFPMLVELQISPQLHRFVYGFYQHAYSQTKRGDGYRPMVFMAHGLHVALFMVLCTTAATALWRMRQKIFVVPAGPIAFYLSVMLVACKSTGALVYAMLIGPFLVFAPTKIQIRAAAALAIVVFSYPVLRTYNLVPWEYALELASEYTNERRVNSLSTRFETEETMMDRIKQRPLLGWASAGRSAIRDETTGLLDTVYDGFWIILLSRRGIVGYVTLFSMLLIPVYFALRSLPRIRARNDRILVCALSFMVTINVFDLIPNSTVEGYLTLMSGALAGLVPGILREQEIRRRNKFHQPGVRIVDPKNKTAALLVERSRHG